VTQVPIADLPPTLVTDVSPSELVPTHEQVAHYAGGSRYVLEEKHYALVDQVIELAQEICRSSVAHALHPVQAWNQQEGLLVLKSGAMLKMPVSLVSSSPQFLSVVVTTLGEKVEQTCQRLRREGDLLRSTFLDAAGLAMLELLATSALDIISSVAQGCGLFIGRRMSPGCYFGLDISLQETIFRLVDGAAIGVHLKASMVMSPLKSQSFLVDLTSERIPRLNESKCLFCPNHDCLYRHMEAI